MPNNNKRPVFLDLTRIYMPVTAVLSFGHRVTGVLMILVIPFLIYLFDLSLTDAQGYARVGELLSGWPLRAGLFLLIWFFMHHFLSGLRFLLTDIDVGLDMRSARLSAWIVFAGGGLSLLLALWLLP